MNAPSWIVFLLLALLLFVAFIDLKKNRYAALKWREYSVLIVGGAMGAAFGALNDVLVSSPLSPEYFEFGKGVQAGDGFRLRVALVGLQAGVGPGALAMVVFLYVNSRNPVLPSLPYRKLLPLAVFPMVFAVFFGALFAACLASFDPLDFRECTGGTVCTPIPELENSLTGFRYILPCFQPR